MELWQRLLQQLNYLRDESEAKNLGIVAGIAIECPPLGVQLVLVGSLENLDGIKVLTSWKEILRRNIESGRQVKEFTEGHLT